MHATMTNITFKGSGYQVLVRRWGNDHYKFFPLRQYGGKRNALKAAKACRDDLIKKLGRPWKMISKRKPKENHTTGIIGVCKFIYDFGYGDVLFYVCSYKSGDDYKTRSFHVGKVNEITADDELHAFKTAVQFRRDYEQHAESDIPFNHHLYNGWRDRKLYDGRKIRVTLGDR